MYINGQIDLHFTPWPTCSAKLFTDESFLFKSITTERDQLSLQSDLSSLEQREKDWQMEFKTGQWHQSNAKESQTGP